LILVKTKKKKKKEKKRKRGRRWHFYIKVLDYNKEIDYDKEKILLEKVGCVFVVVGDLLNLFTVVIKIIKKRL
jgi:hypothetical protein